MEHEFAASAHGSLRSSHYSASRVEPTFCFHRAIVHFVSGNKAIAYRLAKAYHLPPWLP